MLDLNKLAKEGLDKIIKSDKTPEVVDKVLEKVKEQIGQTETTPVDPPSPTPSPTPEPPAPVPASDQWRVSMFYPLKSGVPWTGNSGTDSLLDYAICHGKKWEDDMRINGFEKIKACGGNGACYISEYQLYRNPELRMFLCHEEINGKRVPPKEDFVLIARTYGITKWVVSLFNDDDKPIPDNQHEDYIKVMAQAYSWASPDEVAFLICLECNDRFTPESVAKRVGWVRKYAPDKRVIAGAQDVGYLKKVFGLCSCELWLETDKFPLTVDMDCAKRYLTSLKELKAMGAAVWAGEYGNGHSDVSKYITSEALKLDLAGIGSYVQ